MAAPMMATPLIVIKKRNGDSSNIPTIVPGSVYGSPFTTAHTMKDIGDYFGVHDMTVSRAVRQFKDAEDDE